MTTTVRFSQLVAGDGINVRATGRRDGIAELAASIAAHGLLQPLLVRERGEGSFEVIDGNRRFVALERLVEREQMAAEDDVPVRVFGRDEAAAREASLAANVVRLPLHPVDQYEAFAGLADAGMPADEIAGRFGVAQVQVRRQMALGSLHPVIRQAWRAGKIDNDAARAFTLAQDSALQLALFTDLKSKGQLWGRNIRAMLGATHDVSTALSIIGADAYRAAGGTVTEDLFGSDVIVSDPELAKKLLADRLRAECDRRVAEGWSFAILKDGVKDYWSWPRLTPSGKNKGTPEQQQRLADIRIALDAHALLDELTDEQEAENERLQEERDELQAAIAALSWGPKQKKTSGCFVGVHGGAIEITYGVQNPKTLKAAAQKKSDAEHDDDHHDQGDAPPALPKISNALHFALSEQRTIAVARALEADPALALRAVVAAMEVKFAPLRIECRGYEALSAGDSDAPEGFDTLLAQLAGYSDAEVLDRLAIVASRTLDLRSHNPLSEDKAKALLTAIDRREYLEHALEVFDAEAYFKSVNADLCKAALVEMVGRNDCASSKKADLAARCAARAREHRWLPPELRHPDDRAALKQAAE
jgi:ParB family chromosome partitioning protein